MEDIGVNWEQPRSNLRLKVPSDWPVDNLSLQYITMFLVLAVLFYGCKNFKLSTTKYARGKEYTI